MLGPQMTLVSFSEVIKHLLSTLLRQHTLKHYNNILLGHFKNQNNIEPL